MSDRLENPYAAPQTAALPPSEEDSAGAGPAWERRGPFVRRLLGTVRDCFKSPAAFFADMRVNGGFWMPTLFAVLTGTVATFVAAALELVIEPPEGENAWSEYLAQSGGLIFVPVFIALSLYIQAGMFHGALWILRGLSHPFEATLRLTSYAAGCASALVVIPGRVGTWANGIAVLAFMYFGLTQVHRVGAFKAWTAIFGPIVVIVWLMFWVVAWAGISPETLRDAFS